MWSASEHFRKVVGELSVGCRFSSSCVFRLQKSPGGEVAPGFLQMGSRPDPAGFRHVLRFLGRLRGTFPPQATRSYRLSRPREAWTEPERNLCYVCLREGNQCFAAIHAVQIAPLFHILMLSDKTRISTDSDYCAFAPKLLVSFPRTQFFPETIKLWIRGFFRARNKSCITCYYEAGEALYCKRI